MLLDKFSMFEFNKMFLLFKEKFKDLSSKFLFTLTSVRLLTWILVLLISELTCNNKDLSLQTCN
jgi:hypothetical protein